MLGADQLEGAIPPDRARPPEGGRGDADVRRRAATLDEHHQLEPVLAGQLDERRRPLGGVGIAEQDDVGRRRRVPVATRRRLVLDADRHAAVGVDRGAVTVSGDQRRPQVGRDLPRGQALGEGGLVGGEQAGEVAGSGRRRRRGSGHDGRRDLGDGRRGHRRCDRRCDGWGGSQHRSGGDPLGAERGRRRHRGPPDGDRHRAQGGAERQPACRPAGQPSRVPGRVFDEPHGQGGEADRGEDQRDAGGHREGTEPGLGQHEDRPVPEVDGVGVAADPLQRPGPQHDDRPEPVGAHAAGDEDEHGAQHRQDRGRARERRGAVVGRDGDDDADARRAMRPPPGRVPTPSRTQGRRQPTRRRRAARPCVPGGGRTPTSAGRR